MKSVKYYTSLASGAALVVEKVVDALIEHVWGMFKRKIKSSSKPPKTLNELRNAALAAWDSIPQVDVRNIIQNMPDRMQAVIRARGGNTRY
ncbi:unnamed protein product [Parnassius mnemosyne]|uniref:Transposase n=1 Tax=Parnassius mnemosyne TaxID=213953 RepID=A0AAV1KGW9_9NEOP